MSLDDATSNLIADIYSGAGHPTGWDGVIASLIDRTKSRFVFAATLDMKAAAFPAMAHYGCDEGRFLDGMAEYADYAYLDDLGVKFTRANPHARFFDARQVIGDAHYFDHPYVRWFSDRLGSAYWQTAYTAPDDGLMFGLALHGSAARGPLSDENTRLYKLLFEHMERANRLAARPANIVDDKTPTLLVDRTGRVRQLSDAAGALIGENDGVGLDARRLRTTSRRDQPRLDAVLNSALGALEQGSLGGTLKLPRPSGRRDLLIKISPLPVPPPPFDAMRPAALVRIVVPDARLPEDAKALWKAYFGLTPAEARLAETLMRGDGTLRDAADEIGIAYATARVQLASVFDKTGTRSQAQLASVLGRLQVNC